MEEFYPFVETSEKEVQVEWFKPCDVLMIVSDKKGGSLHYIGDKVYKGLHLTLEDYEEIWYQYGFRATDKRNVVNMSKVKYFDESMRLLYFVDSPASTCLSASVANIHVALVKDLKRDYSFVFSSELQHEEDSKNKSYAQGRLIRI